MRPAAGAWQRREAGRLILELYIQPGAARSEVAGMHGERLKIRLAARPIEGEANAALVRFLAGRFGVPRSKVSIESGAKSRNKRVCVRDCAQGPEVLVGPTPGEN